MERRSSFNREDGSPDRDSSPPSERKTPDAERGRGLVPLTTAHSSLLPLPSVLKIEVISAAPSFVSPWQVRPQVMSSGSGFAVGGSRIITNRHVIQDAVVIRVMHFGSATRYAARILSTAPDCDLALLAVDDERFWSGLPLLPLNQPLPALYEAVSVVGFPTGGKTICVTRGIVSRIDSMNYNANEFNPVGALLVVQIDAAINPGNSGGPVFDSEGDVIGVAFSKSSDHKSDNVGYIIPTLIVRNFLHQYDRTGKYTGIPQLGYTVQTLENRALRAKVGLQPDQTGVMITRIAPLGAAHSVLHVGDVVRAIDGHHLSNDGSVLFRKNELVAFDHLITCKPKGEPTEYIILRDKAEAKISVTHMSVRSLAPRYAGFDASPTYYIFGGLVFAPLSYPLFIELNRHVASGSLIIGSQVVDRGFYRMPAHEDEELVTLLRVLSHDVNFGYEAPVVFHVKEVEGQEVRSIRHLMALVKGATGQFITFTLHTEQQVTLDRELCIQKEREILDVHGVPQPCSKNLLS